MKKNIKIACLLSVSLCLHAPLRLTSLTARARSSIPPTRVRTSLSKVSKPAIGDSDAEISGDLRAEVYRMLKDGATDEEIKEFMVRYGRYVLYNPPLDKHTLILWFGPAVLLILGIFVGLRIGNRKKHLKE